ncbi:iron-containing alcohol dehydrogenase [Staphylococcus equorum]|uniref:iron-containing alcohol dehydrogenase n=1 Tax=Staphylococcus equorum TaxID=246432 RepID=UPI003D8032B0
MSKYIFQSPSRYIQGKGEIKSLAKEVNKLGDAPLIISDSLVWSLTNKDINESFKSSEVSYKYEEFNGEASENEIAKLNQIAKDHNINVIVGVGGGKTLDTAKAISDDGLIINDKKIKVYSEKEAQNIPWRGTML